MVSIVYSGMLAYESIKPGDIVTKVNDTPVPDKSTAKKVLLNVVNMFLDTFLKYFNNKLNY